MSLVPVILSEIARPLRNTYIGYYRPLLHAARKCSSASSADDDKGFVVKLDLHQYSPKEITVKTIENHIIIEGKHEEKLDEHGFIARHFIRRYVLPKSVQVEAVSSTLSSDGVLTVTAPEIPNKKQDGERVIPIITTGKIEGGKDGKSPIV